jgi:phosphonate degradation associated HDIG domain protein
MVNSAKSVDSALSQIQQIFTQAQTSDYVGEPISQAEHALQAAALASNSGDNELVIAALLHDIGHMCFPDAEAMGDVGVLHHEHLGADYLFSLGFSKRVAILVGQHVNAKRYLVATNPAYAKKLSDASRKTLGFQGGAMSSEEAEQFAHHPDSNNVLRLRAWDEAAKEVDKSVPSLTSYLPLLRSHLEQQQLTDDQVVNFHKHGFLHLKDVFGDDQIARLKSAATYLGDLPETQGKWMKYFESSAAADRLLCRIENFVQYQNELGSLIDGPRLLGWISQLLDEPACLFKEKINFKLPGAGGFQPHQDAPAFTTFNHDYHITMMLSFDASTLENGCLELVSGSWPNEYLPLKSDLTLSDDTVSGLDWQPLPTKPGDVVLFGSYLPHRSGENKSDLPRRALYATYNRLSAGSVRDAYFAEKRRVFPPDVERVAGKEYKGTGVFNVGNPVSRE